MDYYTISAQCAILSRELLNSRIDTVKFREPYSVFLGFDSGKAVRLTCTPDMPYLVTIQKRFIPVRQARDWHLKRFLGKKLVDLSVAHGDRILTFSFDSGIQLVFEMTGRHTNIIIIGQDNIIAGSVRTVTARESGIREISPGIPYVPPPARHFPDIIQTPHHDLEKYLRSFQGSLEESLMRTLCSGSRLFALEACARADIKPFTSTGDIDTEKAQSLIDTVVSLASHIEQGGSGATIVFSRDGLPQNVFPVRMTNPLFPCEYKEDLDEAVHHYARTREIELERRSLRNSILEALKREERRISSTMFKVDRERGGNSEPELLERWGNTILANLHRITKGMKSAVVSDPYGSGDVEIELEPSLNGPSNASHFFSRARKLRSASLLAGKRLAGLRSRLEKNSAEREKALSLNEIADLKMMASVYVRAQNSERELQFDEKFPRRFTSVSGLDIIVGRNETENYELVR